MGMMGMMGMMPRSGSCSAGTYCVPQQQCNPYTGFIIRGNTAIMAVWPDSPTVPFLVSVFLFLTSPHLYTKIAMCCPTDFLQLLLCPYTRHHDFMHSFLVSSSQTIGFCFCPLYNVVLSLSLASFLTVPSLTACAARRLIPTLGGWTKHRHHHQ